MVSIDADTGADGASLDLPDTGDSPERALLRGERARHLHDAIRALPDRLDEVVERNFFGDESLTDIARTSGVTLSRVSQMRARALTLLHAAMSEVWEGRPVAGRRRRARPQPAAGLRRPGRRPARRRPATRPRSAPRRRRPLPAARAPGTARLADAGPVPAHRDDRPAGLTAPGRGTAGKSSPDSGQVPAGHMP